MCSGTGVLHFHGIRQNNNNVSLNVAGVTRIIKNKGSGHVESDWGQGVVFWEDWKGLAVKDNI